ncbi:MAG: RNHCP domain-containing protein [Fimbriimonadaceae bacterium]|nr:RNHCP domain-containing protein [Fimbriimonadaceae bacterium]
MNWSPQDDSERQKQKKIRKKAAKLRTRERREGGPITPSRVWERRVNEAGGKADALLGFSCRKCGMLVPWDGGGTEHRNHCPSCLHSVHLDIEPGDRAADCGAVMEPISVWVRRKGEWAIVHRCLDCGALSSNRIAADDNEVLLVSLAMRPIAMPPFPLDRQGQRSDEEA